MEPIKGMPHNSGLAAPFYRETLEPAKPSGVLKIQKQVGRLGSRDRKGSKRKRDEIFRSCLSGRRRNESGLGPEDKDVIQEEAL